ncbi:unnamed protein product [Phyllotreta striolata]|uniref:Uncharacterized protein n=1 Tax=Phyllotreta striolata TaxID=444603 RepID=A0A9N9TIU5_PHYSR|nr:unnamed protein product [Phyllotreta striolata]
MESVAPEFEELMLCGYCKQKFNETDQSPKLLSCKHYFCLQCMRTNLAKGQELYCVYCWKKTDCGDMGPDSLPTYNPVLCLAKNFSQLKLGPKPPPPDKPPPPPAVSHPPAKVMVSENCHTHAMPLALWCHTCGVPVCRACATTNDHLAHQVKSHSDAKDQLIAELQIDLSSMNKMLSEIQRLVVQQREFLLKILEACVTLKTYVEAELTNNATHFELTDARDALAKLRANLSMAESLSDVHNLCAGVNVEKRRLQMRYQEMYLQCQLDDLIRNSSVAFDFHLLKQALGNIHNGEPVYTAGNSRIVPSSQQNPILFLANYCMSQLYSRHMLSKPTVNGSTSDYQNHNSINYLPHNNAPTPQQQHLVIATPKNIYQENNIVVPSPSMRNPPNMCPLYYFNIDVNGAQLGRIVIEVRADVAPKMAKNFALLTTGEAGVGYKGCQIFQCWEGESVITGDFESNNGRGGRSVFEESYFLPDDTKLMAVRGTVGMRRTQKRHDNLGMVGSQFRIILQEMRGFTGIFGHVVEGLELVEKISTYGDTAGKPTKNISIAKCAKVAG